MNIYNFQIESRGRLGNQMFIYAFSKRYIHEKGGRAAIIISPQDNRLTCFELDNRIEFTAKLNYKLRNKIGIFLYQLMTRGGMPINKISSIERKHQNLFSWFGLHMSQESCLAPTESLGNAIALGYFQSERCFSKVKSEIRQDFKFRISIIKKCKYLVNQIEKSESCCIHIRRGDYLKSPIFCVCTDDYYKKAIKLITERIPNVKFYVFSDSIYDVKNTFGEILGPNASYIPDNYTDQESMYIGSRCKHFIMSNSTFSWWMQYLSEYENKKVIAPSRWYNDGRECYIYQPNWELIDP